MYYSRLHFKTDYISIAIDSTTGEILELINLKTSDNLIKSNAWNIPGTFLIYKPDGARVTLPTSSEVKASPELKPEIVSEETEKGLRISVSYARLAGADGSCRYIVLLKNNEAVAEFTLETDIVNTHCEFPVLNGIWIGDDYESNTLVYPFNAGIKLENPIKKMAMQPERVMWRWQDYRYSYNLKGMGLHPSPEGFYSLSYKYSGPLSMAYCDLYNDESGFCICCPSPEGIISVTARTKGTAEPGMSFCIDFVNPEGVPNRKMTAVVYLHSGTWHEAADFYRQLQGVDKKGNNSVFKKSTGLAAHYDFKYQNGGIVHKFRDIPELAEEAAKTGLEHLLIAGWHQDGFDNGFPQYWADSELGTTEELEQGIEYAHSLNIGVMFYINSRLANTKYSVSRELLVPAAAADINGNPQIERYGDSALEFATMCAGSKAWREHIKKAFEYIKNVKADGVYFDQIGMAPPCICYNKTHGHEPDEWNKGCREMIKTAKAIGLSVIIEGCSDLYGDIADGQLVSTFSYIDCAFPELYKYTYPSHRLVDMVYPKRNLAMRPVFVANRQKQLNDVSYLTDTFFWAYDLADDNTFSRDPKSLEYLKKTLKVRKKLVAAYPDRKYVHTHHIHHSDIPCSVFETDKGLLVCFAGGGSCIEITGEYKLKELYSADNIIAERTILSGKTRIQIDGAGEEAIGFIALEK